MSLIPLLTTTAACNLVCNRFEFAGELIKSARLVSASTRNSVLVVTEIVSCVSAQNPLLAPSGTLVKQNLEVWPCICLESELIGTSIQMEIRPEVIVKIRLDLCLYPVGFGC